MSAPPRVRRATLLLLLAPLLAGGARGEEIALVQLLDNGDFAETVDPKLHPTAPVPWWKGVAGADAVTRRGERSWLRTTATLRASQPLAAYRPLAGGTVITGRVEGVGALTVTDGTGRSVRVVIDGTGTAAGVGRAFEITLDRLQADREALAAEGIVVEGDAAAFEAPVPRLVLELTGLEGVGPARWTGLEARVPLPCPTEAELRAELLEHLRWIVAQWDEFVVDPESGFARYIHDVVTGERLYTRGGGLHPVSTLLGEAARYGPEPRWVELNEHFLESWFAHCFHPETGLPRMWNPAKGGRDDKAQEVQLPLEFLDELAVRGPEQWREPALAHARRIAAHVLTRGVLPDGEVAGGYRPGDGEPVQGYPHLRRLDAPAQLARLSSRVGDPRLLDAARGAVLSFEYTWLWPGTWQAIDPGLDDAYGHYGARALEMYRAWPEERIFRRVVRGGYDYYLSLWPDALRLGGNVAADQVRCWEIVIGLAELEPELLPEVSSLLRAAVRLHFKGEQYENGAWGDVTVFDFDPKAGLQVGDLPGVPQNLLQGLGFVYREELGVRDAATRAMFTAVMRSSVEQYREPHGYLLGRRRLAGANPAGGSLRFAAGLVEMLGRLSP